MKTENLGAKAFTISLRTVGGELKTFSFRGEADGGIRDMKAAEAWLTACVALGLDARDGYVATEGWTMPIPVIASGGLASVGDIVALRAAGAGIAGAILGGARNDGRVDPEAALEAARG
jgi:phosphoribosylformimino-5-aminoimidazole carboxamide ribonucleotide (ProFAR) isomerase